MPLFSQQVAHPLPRMGQPQASALADEPEGLVLMRLQPEAAAEEEEEETTYAI